MMPRRIFLDTNVYIIGAADPASAEGRILLWAGFDGRETDVEIVKRISRAQNPRISFGSISPKEAPPENAGPDPRPHWTRGACTAMNVKLHPRDFLNVHMKTGEPCPRGGTMISLVGASQRTTNFCRRCQTGGPIDGM